MSKFPWKSFAAGAVVLAGTAYVFAAQLTPGNGPMGRHGQMQQGGMMSGTHAQMMQGGMSGDRAQMHQQMMQSKGMSQGMHGGMHGQQFGAAGMPTLPGQDAFGAIQEVVRILEADPSTDWSKVNIAALREHLIDMNEVTLHAKADEHATDNGVEIAVTGEGRTLDAIKRMVPAHVHELAALGWNAATAEMPNGVKLIVTANETVPLAKLKALGFMGIMVQGGHHQPHHLMMAKGVFVH